MVKCNNPDCPVPLEGYPTGRILENVMMEWNWRNQSKLAEEQNDR